MEGGRGKNSTHNPLEATPAEVREMQESDPSLAGVRQKAEQFSSSNPSDERVYFYRRSDGQIFRSWRPKGTTVGTIRQYDQLVLPYQLRPTVLCLAHDVPMSGYHQDKRLDITAVLLAMGV